MTDLSTVKRVVIGRPRASRELKHQLLPKWMALPVFSSDPLSSVAYATEEMMLVLALAGTQAFDDYVMPLAFAVAALLAIVIVSYRQTVRAYPQGGGAYRVAKENLGEIPGLTAGAALLIDYSLTVSVSIAAGVAAIISAVSVLEPYRLELALMFVAFVTVANLRGVKEAGGLFAIPTYTFVATMFVMIGVGLVRCVGGCPPAPVTGAVEGGTAITLFLVLRAFASGSTALTGVEAISDGVQAFRYPQSRNAATTLAVMGAMAITMFLGISFLATHIPNVIAFEDMPRTVTAQIALALFGSGFGFIMVQVVTAAILILAANTAYADFPRLGSILAGDRYLPRQFVARGDRLAFSNGIVVLALVASLLLIVFDAELSKLIQLYVVGVFTSFTLSQTGMVRHWLRTRSRGWRRSAFVNGIGGATTGVVLVVVAVTKFTHGAWAVIVAIPLVVLLMKRIRHHYTDVTLELLEEVTEAVSAKPIDMAIVFDRIDESVARALSYARSVNPARLVGYAFVTPGSDLASQWHDFAPGVPLEVIDLAEQRRPDMEFITRLAERDADQPDHFTTAVVAETLSANMLEVVRQHRLALRIKTGLVGRGLIVSNVTAPDLPGPYAVQEPVEHHVIVLVSGVNRATVRALSFAQGLRGTTLRALSVNMQSERSSEILEAWDDWGIEVPLELLDSPFRSLTDTIREYVRDFEPDGRHTVLTCVLPEFVLPKWVHRPLHNQTALQIKATLLLERGVVVTSVPVPLRAGQKPTGPTAEVVDSH